MTSDLPGEPGTFEPGLDQLFRTLTAPATPDERAGEQDALAMFRANVRPGKARRLPVHGGSGLAPGHGASWPGASRPASRGRA